LASNSPVPLIEMGLRRALGLDTAYIASYNAFLNGFKSTSHVIINHDYGIPSEGTMSHAFVTSFESINLQLKDLKIP